MQTTSTYISASHADAKIKLSEFQGILDQMRKLREDTALQADRLARALSRAYGDVPPDATKSIPRSVPCGVVGCLHEVLNDLRDDLSSIAEAVSRIDNMV